MSTATRSFEATSVGLNPRSTRLLLCPTVALYTVPFYLYNHLLSYRVCKARINEGTVFGDNCCPSGTCANKTGCAKKTPGPNDPLYVATRCHGNFLENVPMSLFLACVAELNGADRGVLGWMLGTLFVLRVAHVEGGLRRKDGTGCGRKVGYFGTQAWMMGMTVWCAALVRDYWGF